MRNINIITQDINLQYWKKSINHKTRKYNTLTIMLNQNTRFEIDCIQQAIAEVS